MKTILAVSLLWLAGCAGEPLPRRSQGAFAELSAKQAVMEGTMLNSYCSKADKLRCTVRLDTGHTDYEGNEDSIDGAARQVLDMLEDEKP